MLTRHEPKPIKPLNRREQFKELASISVSALEDFLTGRLFAAIENVENGGMVWKHGSPWLYPKHEFEQLKTLVKVTLAAIEEERDKAKKPPKPERPELPDELKQKRMLAAKNFHQAMSKKVN